jgi:amino acid adenylation domain-containing protein
MHHIVSDGWSMGVLMNELATLYAGGTLPPLAIQYPDFSAWQRSWLSGDVLDQQLAYWKHQLAGAPGLIELPTDRPRPPVMSSRGAMHSFRISAEIMNALNALSRQHSATLFMTLLAAFQALLSRYSRQDDIVVGSPIANRNRSEIEPLIGFFVNTLVLRTDLAGNPTFVELLGRVRETALGAYAHQDVPFEKLVEELHPERNLSHTPLFQVMFAVQTTAAGATLSGIEQTYVELDAGTTQFDLGLTLGETPNGLVGSVEYGTDLFDAATIERMMGHYSTLLESIVASSDQPIGQLAIMSERERTQLVVDWNATSTSFTRAGCLHELVEQQVDRTPDAIAIELGTSTLTYRELDTRANQLAHHLISLGVQPDTRVGICVERSIEMMVGLLAILKAGGAYLPLDPGYPPDRLAYMLVDSSVPLLLTQQRLAATLETFGARLVQLDADWPAISQLSTARPGRLAGGENLAYVIYTSGSTGRPKGVQVEHQMVANLVLGFGELEKMSPSDRSLQFSSIAFDGSVNELFVPLVFGATNVLRGEDVPTPHELLGEKFRGVTVFNMATAYWHAIAASLQAGDVQLPAALRLVNMGGERALPERVAAWLELAPGCGLNNLYGPAETTDITTVWQLNRDELIAGREVPIGMPLPNYSVYLLDSGRQPVPVGIPGEIYIGGVGVARGYLNQPTLTAERFVPNPFGAGRLYRTGDYARRFPNGNLEFIGRVDHQVKIRGFRIELGEIEAALAEHEHVESVVVLAREDTRGDKRLVGYVVGREGPIEAAELRSFLKSKLPDYMIPFVFISLPEMPLTTNGKVDTRALPAPDRSATADTYVPPRTETEQKLAEVWADVLKLERVSVEDNFFELGGHSLLATQVASRVRTVFEVELPLRTLFEATTVVELAKVIEAGRHGIAPPIDPVSREGDLELSFAQQRLWFLEQLSPGSIDYNMSGAISLKGSLDAAALARAVESIVARHEALRTTFTSRDGKPVQVIAASMKIDMPVIEVASSEEAYTLAKVEVQRAFDLERGPLLRTTLLRLGPEEHWLLLSMHHIVSDLWSMAVLMEELTAFYTGHELPPLRIQYADFAAWQRAYLSTGVLDEQLAYWREQLAGAPAQLELPTDRPRPRVLSSRGASISFTLPASLAKSLDALSRASSSTMFMTMLAAFKTLLHRYSRQQDIVVGSPVANRNRAETEGLIGFFINTLVLRTDLSGNPTFRELLARVREVALGAYGHQDVPFERIVVELQPERSLSHTPLFQAMFALENVQGDSSLPGIEQTPIAVDVGTAKFELTLVVEERTDGLHGTFEYNTDLFESATIERMIRHYQILLEGIVADADCRIGNLPLLTEQERNEFVVSWNDTARDWPGAMRIEERIATQVLERPDAVAIEHRGRRVTYAELDRRANQIGHVLRRRGVGPGTIVAVHLERSIDLVASWLAAWKVGAAYLPIASDLGAERVAYMLEDAAVPLLVTTTALADRLTTTTTVPMLDLDRESTSIAQNPVEPPGGATDSDAPAYVIYTSGSTGKPKGSIIEHRSLGNLISWHNRSFAIHPGTRTSHIVGASFDACVWETWPTLVAGGTLCMIEDELRIDPVRFRDWLVDCRVALSIVPTPLAEPLLGLEWPASCELKTILTGGDRLTRRPPPSIPFTLVNNYGPTECTVLCLSGAVLPAGQASASPPNLGRPVDNSQIYVLDPYGAPTPVGIPGEIFIGGACVGAGYLGRPELDAQKFLPNPFAPGLMYQTGDLARWLADGTIDFIGRIDQQVKIRGFRIELGEIEAALAAHPSIRDVVVIAREDVPGEKRLVAYVTGKAGSPDANVLREHITGGLPEYMIPSAFVVLDQLPLTSNGKVDRKVLPAPDRTVHFVAPRTPTEAALAEIFERLLHVENVGALGNFFELGGHSLLSLQLASAIKAQLGASVPTATLFAAPTVEALAHAIDTQSESGASNLVTLRADGEGVPLILVHAVGGTIYSYFDLVKRLAPGRPCYAFQAKGLNDGEEPLETVEQMASDYIDTLRTVIGSGPCHLAGWSFGGVVVHEMARRMTAEGMTVSVTLLDAFAPSMSRGGPLDSRSVLEHFAHDIGLQADRSVLDGLDREQSIERLLALASAASLLPRELGAAELSRIIRVFEINIVAGAEHDARPYGGDVTLVRAKKEKVLDSKHGFGPLVTGTLDVQVTAGDHYSMFRAPDVAELARLLDVILSRVETQLRRLRE